MTIHSAHIVGGRASGGAERFYTWLVNALQERGHPTLAINVRDSAVSAELRPDVLQEHVGMRSIWDLWSRWRIGRILRERRPDIVQTYMGRATRLTHLARNRRPVHVARLGSYYDLKGYRHAHAWIGITRGICDYLVQHGLPAARVFHIGNFVDIPAPTAAAERVRLRESLGIPDEALLVVSVGRLHPLKGIDDLLRALAMLPVTLDQRPVYLAVVGDGPMRAQLGDLADALGVAPRVRWAGWQSDPGAYYDLADLFVFPTRYEGHGNVLLEAWAHGKPVLSTRAAGPLELATHEQNALFVPIEDPAALADGMLRLLGDPRLRDSLGQAGYRRVIEHHSKESVIDAYLDLYSRLLG